MNSKLDDVWKIPSKLAIGVIMILLTGAISFNVWAVTSIGERPTRLEVKELIEDKSPYSKDRNMVLQALARVENSNLELARAVSELQTELVEWKMQTSRDR